MNIENVKAGLDKARHWLKVYALAPSRSRHGQRRAFFLLGVTGFLLGTLMAVMMANYYKAQEKEEAFRRERLQRATPPPGQGEKRWLALEQLKLFLNEK